MCDTIVALGNATATGSTLFAKNSDREPNEAHELEIVEGGKHPSGSKVRCTYIEIPQVKRTHTVLLSKPFWIWGAEMGANEHGVVIGNEAVFTKYSNKKEPGLIGMDFLRLALERSDTAASAMEVITTLLEEYGQSGNCGFLHSIYYDNSYLIADHAEAWVLETAGKQWAAEKVVDIRSISNALTIEGKWDLASKDLVDEAVKQGWCRKRSEFNFRKCYSDFLYTTFSAAANRFHCSSELLREKKGQITSADMMQILRTHRSQKDPKWSPTRSISGADICMHSGFGPIRGSQTNGSMVGELGKEKDLFWLTGTAAPCLSLFKPVWMDSGLPEVEKYPEGKYDPATLWWRGEELNRKAMMNYPEASKLIEAEQHHFEARWMEESKLLQKKSTASRREFTKSVFLAADQISRSWLEKMEGGNFQKLLPFYYASFRKTIDKQADFPD
jgi:secernin